MSQGTHVYPVRLPDDQVEEIQMVIMRRNLHTRDKPWTFSDFVRIALREKVSKMARSRGKPERLPAGPAETWIGIETNRLKLPEH